MCTNNNSPNLLHRWLLLIAVIALIINLAAGFKLEIDRPLISDAEQFRQIAVSLARGDGYTSDVTFWPGQPTLQRMPGWPCLSAVMLRIWPGVSPDRVMRLLCLILNAMVAVSVAWLAWRMFGRLTVAGIAGLLYAFHPAGIYLAYNASSEMFFLVLAAAGGAVVLGSARWRWSGFGLLGLAALERANFVLWIVFFSGLAGWRLLRNRNTMPGWSLRMLALGLLLFLIPTMLWTLRNYRVTGHWPVLSTLRGQTFYGGNNEVVSHDFKYWGYWVFPDQIPGETRLAEIVKNGATEYDADVHYFQSGLRYVHEHWRAMPRLVAGKLVRAYLPIPWVFSREALINAVYRWLIAIMVVWGIVTYWRKLPATAQALFIAMILTNLFTVVIFWGNNRFAFALEPLLLGFAGIRIVEISTYLKTRKLWRFRVSRVLFY